jgi:hypothetical protein
MACDSRLGKQAGVRSMAIQFNHTILYGHDSETAAAFLAEMLGLPDPVRWGPFTVVKTDNGTNLDYMDVDGEITRQHYAFLVEESDFDDIFKRISGRKLPYWADPGQTQQGISSRLSPTRTAAAAGILSGKRPAKCLEGLTAPWRSPRSSFWRRRAPSWCCRGRTADCRCRHSRWRATAC